MGNRQVVERYARSMADNDLDAQMALIHDDYECRYPQSGEIIRGRDNLRRIVESYPETTGEGLAPTVGRIIGTDDQFVSQPSWPAWSVVHLSGSGDDFTLTGIVTYPSGEAWHAVALLTLLDGKIWRETDYFAAPFEAPEWRAPYVDRESEPVRSDGPAA
jgi:hypothetical protein